MKTQREDSQLHAKERDLRVKPTLNETLILDI